MYVVIVSIKCFMKVFLAVEGLQGSRVLFEDMLDTLHIGMGTASFWKTEESWSRPSRPSMYSA